MKNFDSFQIRRARYGFSSHVYHKKSLDLVEGSFLDLADLLQLSSTFLHFTFLLSIGFTQLLVPSNVFILF
jgi:hypothetical protein